MEKEEIVKAYCRWLALNSNTIIDNREVAFVGGFKIGYAVRQAEEKERTDEQV